MSDLRMVQPIVWPDVEEWSYEIRFGADSKYWHSGTLTLDEYGRWTDHLDDNGHMNYSLELWEEPCGHLALSAGAWFTDFDFEWYGETLHGGEATFSLEAAGCAAVPSGCDPVGGEWVLKRDYGFPDWIVPSSGVLILASSRGGSYSCSACRGL